MLFKLPQGKWHMLLWWAHRYRSCDPRQCGLMKALTFCMHVAYAKAMSQWNDNVKGTCCEGYKETHYHMSMNALDQHHMFKSGTSTFDLRLWASQWQPGLLVCNRSSRISMQCARALAVWLLFRMPAGSLPPFEPCNPLVLLVIPRDSVPTAVLIRSSCMP